MSRSSLLSILVIFGILELVLTLVVVFIAYSVFILPNVKQIAHLNETEATLWMENRVMGEFGVDTEFFKKVVSGGIVSQFLALIGI